MNIELAEFKSFPPSQNELNQIVFLKSSLFTVVHNSALCLPLHKHLTVSVYRNFCLLGKFTVAGFMVDLVYRNIFCHKKNTRFDKGQMY